MTMNELARLAANAQMMQSAPKKATRSILIDSPAGRVWEILTDVADWERWHPCLANAALTGSFAAGSNLVYGRLIKHHLHIAKVVHGDMVMLYGTMAGYKGITRWDVKKAGIGKTKVSFTECSSGFLIGRVHSNEKLGEHLQRWPDALKSEAQQL